MLSIALAVIFWHFSHQENFHHLSAISLKLSCFSFSFSNSPVYTNPTNVCYLSCRAGWFFHLLLNPDSGPDFANPHTAHPETGRSESSPDGAKR